MKIGYARVSTDDQSLALQLHALRAAQCDIIFEDIGISGSKASRPGLSKALRRAEPGDVIVVWRLDRLGRSLHHLINLIADLRSRKVGFMSLQEQIDTTNPTGRFYLHMLAALAEFERELIRERTRAGLEAARRRGVTLGRPKIMTAAMIAEAKARRSRAESVDQIAAALGVSPNTLRRALAK